MEALLKKYKKLTTVQLLVRVEKLKGEELEACLAALEGRGTDITKWQTPESAEDIPNAPAELPVMFESDEELSPEDLARIEAVEKALDETPATPPVPEPTATPEKPVETPATPAADLKATVTKLMYPEGFEKGMAVKFEASKRSKTPREILTGKIKRYYFDKQDDCNYFVIGVGEKEYCKRPKFVTKA